MEDIFLSIWVPLISILWIGAWIAGTVVAAAIFRRERGRAQRIALWGFSLMLAVTVTRIALPPLLSLWLGASEISRSSTIAVVSGFLALVQVAAIVCIAYAFWRLGKAKVSAQ